MGNGEPYRVEGKFTPNFHGIIEMETSGSTIIHIRHEGTQYSCDVVKRGPVRDSGRLPVPQMQFVVDPDAVGLTSFAGSGSVSSSTKSKANQYFFQKTSVFCPETYDTYESMTLTRKIKQ